MLEFNLINLFQNILYLTIWNFKNVLFKQKDFIKLYLNLNVYTIF